MIRRWRPVRAEKTRPIKNLEPCFDPIETENALVAFASGRGIANPYGTILSVGMLLRHSLGLNTEAQALESAVEHALEGGARTPDIAAGSTPARSTREVADSVLARLAQTNPG